MKIRAIGNWVVIRPEDQQEETVGGIIVPDAAKEKSQIGEVLSVGPGHMKEINDSKGKLIEKTFEATVVKIGDRVFYDKYAGNKVDVDGEEQLILREDTILGFIE